MINLIVNLLKKRKERKLQLKLQLKLEQEEAAKKIAEKEQERKERWESRCKKRALELEAKREFEVADYHRRVDEWMLTVMCPAKASKDTTGCHGCDTACAVYKSPLGDWTIKDIISEMSIDPVMGGYYNYDNLCRRKRKAEEAYQTHVANINLCNFNGANPPSTFKGYYH
jgi:hypothetical protein